MKIRETRRTQLAALPAGCPQVTFRGTKFNTVVLQDEFRTTEVINGKYVTFWTGTNIICETPRWIRTAHFQAARKLRA